MNSMPQDDCLAWLDAMAIHARGGLEHLLAISQTGKIRATKYCVEYLLISIRPCGVLKHASPLRTFSELLRQLMGYPESWLSETAQIPSAPIVSRQRFTMDVICTILCRDRMEYRMARGILFTMACLWDSSPRGGREGFLAHQASNCMTNMFCARCLQSARK